MVRNSLWFWLGNLHTHTTWSDGTASLAEMVSTADSLGHQYLAITDHSPRLTIAHGLSRESLAAQWAEIAEVQRHHDLRILRGIEVDILGQGALDQADDMLDQLDIVTASVQAVISVANRLIARRAAGQALRRLPIERRKPALPRTFGRTSPAFHQAKGEVDES